MGATHSHTMETEEIKPDHIAGSNRIDCQMHGDEDDDDFGSEDYDDWDEMDDDEENRQKTVDCFFCSYVYRNINLAVSHCSKEHGFDLALLKGRHKMDCYSYIKLINFVRSTRPSCQELMTCKKPLWSDDKYLTPVNNEDPWLMYDFDDVDETPVPPNCGDLSNSRYLVNVEDGRVTMFEKHFNELQRTITRLNNEAQEKDNVVSQLLAEMKRMQITLGSVIGAGGSSGGEVLNNHVADIRLQDDEDYFNSYAHFSIHHEMLSDEVRTESYRDALTLNAASLEGRTVLDLGCGTGILSMFAAKAGATKVIGIDQSEIIYHAMDIVRENQLENKITLVKGRLEDTELPESQVDVIVSEWMGYFLLFEAMLDSVIYARDKHLRPGGLLLPNRCTLSILAISDHAMHKEMLGFWSNVYGFKMSCLRSDVVREPQTRVVAAHTVATSAAQLCLLDLMTVTNDCIDFESEFHITGAMDTELTALVGYFDVFFDLPHPVMFSTSPLSKPTHWKQTVFLIETPIKVSKGEVLQGKLVCRRNRKEVRSLVVTITLGNFKQEYILS